MIINNSSMSLFTYRLDSYAGLIGVVLICILSLGCKVKSEVQFVYLTELLKQKSDSVDLKFFEVKPFLYLSPKVAKMIDDTIPCLLKREHKSLKEFLIAEEGKIVVPLKKKYDHIQNLIRDIEPNVLKILKSSFGISNPKVSLGKKIYLYENMAFIEFIAKDSIHALTFEIKEPNTLIIGLAYVINI